MFQDAWGEEVPERGSFHLARVMVPTLPLAACQEEAHARSMTASVAIQPQRAKGGRDSARVRDRELHNIHLNLSNFNCYFIPIRHLKQPLDNQSPYPPAKHNQRQLS
jgi:hypothetical protein